MSFKKILVATDGSQQSRNAASQAAALARDLSAEVEVFAVAVIQPMYGGLHIGAVGLEGMEDEAQKAAEMAVADTAEVFGEQGIEVRTVVSVAMGNPAAAICQEAEDWGADLIVVGSRGLGRASSLILGSVSQEVVHSSSKPVLVVR
jgi:nucleotide-binding universal stress UspA family protein